MRRVSVDRARRASGSSTGTSIAVSARDVRGGSDARTMWRYARDRWTTMSPGWLIAEVAYGTVMWTGPSVGGRSDHSSAAVRWLRIAAAPPYWSAAAISDGRGSGPVKVA